MFLPVLIIALAGTALAQPDPNLSTATSPGGCLFICPQGDGQSLGGVGATITVTLVDAAGAPVVGYPRADIWADAVVSGDLCYCAGPIIADAPTDAAGQTTISGGVAGGGYTSGMYVYVAGQPLTGSPLAITVTSADISCDLRVDLCDLALFAQDFGSGNPRSDFDCDGQVNIVDVSIFAIHYCHDCVDYGVIEHRGEIGIFFDTAGTQSGILGVPNGTLFNFYVVSMSAPGGIGGYEFGIDVDARILLVNETLYPVGVAVDALGGVGEVSAGIAGPCLPATGPTVLADYLALLVSSDLQIPICLRGPNGACLPDNTDPSYVECDTCIPRYYGRSYTGCAIVNGDGPVSTQHTTWSSVKGLFQ